MGVLLRVPLGAVVRVLLGVWLVVALGLGPGVFAGGWCDARLVRAPALGCGLWSSVWVAAGGMLGVFGEWCGVHRAGVPALVLGEGRCWWRCCWRGCRWMCGAGLRTRALPGLVVWAPSGVHSSVRTATVS